jgi:hypothetical protein
VVLVPDLLQGARHLVAPLGLVDPVADLHHRLDGRIARVRHVAGPHAGVDEGGRLRRVDPQGPLAPILPVPLEPVSTRKVVPQQLIDGLCSRRFVGDMLGGVGRQNAVAGADFVLVL